MASTQSSRQSLADVVGKVLEQLSMLFRMEVQLVRAETSEKMSQLRGAIMMVAAGAFVVLAALVILLGACVVWLQFAGLDPRWASLLVSVGALVLGMVLIQVGLSSFKMSNLTPDRSVEQLRRDARTAQEQF